MELEGSLPHLHVPATCLYLSVWTFRNMIVSCREELLVPLPTPNLEDHPVSAVHDCLFNILAATLHIGGRSSNRKTGHAMVAGTDLSRSLAFTTHKKTYQLQMSHRVIICKYLK